MAGNLPVPALVAPGGFSVREGFSFALYGSQSLPESALPTPVSGFPSRFQVRLQNFVVGTADRVDGKPEGLVAVGQPSTRPRGQAIGEL